MLLPVLTRYMVEITIPAGHSPDKQEQLLNAIDKVQLETKLAAHTRKIIKTTPELASNGLQVAVKI